MKFNDMSLILNKNLTSTNDNLDSTWSFFRKNVMDLFCSNFNMEIKSSYSISMDDEDLQKNYKIETGRNRLEDLEGEKKDSTFKIISSGEYVAKMETLKREMMQVKLFNFELIKFFKKKIRNGKSKTKLAL